MQEFSEFTSEGGGKLRTMVRDDFVKKSEMKEDFVEEKGGNPFGGDGFLHRAKNYPLSKSMVYHNQERIKVQGDGEVSDEIAGDLLEWVRSELFDRGQWRYGGVSVSFVLLAFSAALDISADKGSEVRPPEFCGDQLAGL